MQTRKILGPIWCLAALICLGNPVFAQTEEWTPEKLLKAARQEKVADVQAALAAGIDVNSKNEYGSTALFFACDRGNEAMVDLLLKAGADPNVKDTFYNATPLTWAQQKSHSKIIGKLVAAGGDGGGPILLNAVTSKNVDVVKTIIDSGVIKNSFLVHAKARALKSDSEEIKAIFENVSLDGIETWTPNADLIEQYVGDYKGQFKASVTGKEGKLLFAIEDQPPAELLPLQENEFLVGPTNVKFMMEGEQVTTMNLTMFGRTMVLKPLRDEPEANPEKSMPEKATETKPEPGPKFEPSSEASLAADRAISSANWPGFRGNGSRGVGEGQKPPTEWNVEKEENVAWQTSVDGLGLSCPSIWGDHLYITSAVGTDSANTDLKIGRYGDVSSVEDPSSYQFNVHCLDKNSGKVLWTKLAISGVPKVKRHAKSSHANPTVAANATHVVAFFGSEGLYCYDPSGKLLWKKELGLLDSGWFYDAGYQWGFGSSPVIFEDRVIVQCDIQEGSFIAAYELKDGTEAWRTPREEIPGWSSPTVHEFDDVAMILTHGTKAARGYDARTGKELWSLPKHSEIVVPTPFVSHDLIFVASGYTPIQPIYAIRSTARGVVKMKEGESSNDHVAWSYLRGGPYMPSPIAYGDYFYCCGNTGMLDCYDIKTGERVYRNRLRATAGSGQLNFTASPVAADGHLYLTAEDGRVLVVKAGPEYEVVATNLLDDPILATPAISAGKMFFRTRNHVIAVGK